MIMNGEMPPSRSPQSDRAEWVRHLRRLNEQEEDALASVYDERWGEIESTHREFVERFLSLLPPDGTVLDAACGTGKYFGVVLATNRFVVGVDHSAGYLAVAAAKFPEVVTEKRHLQDLPFERIFDGVMCIDAMEMVPPEDWPVVLARFSQALHPGGWLYLTIELVRQEEVVALNEAARRRGLPVVAGEVWEDSGYHFYPAIDQVRSWMGDAGFVIEAEAEEPWHDDGYSYRHVLSRLAPESGSRTGSL